MKEIHVALVKHERINTRGRTRGRTRGLKRGVKRGIKEGKIYTSIQL